MAQLLLIKDANTEWKTVGDVVGIFEDSHKFSERELEAFNILKIKGTREEITAIINTAAYDKNIARKASTTKWRLEPSEKKDVWKDVDGKWYFLEKKPKYLLSLSNIVVEDITILETLDFGLARDVILRKLVVNPGTWNAVNTTEVRDLN